MAATKPTTKKTTTNNRRIVQVFSHLFGSGSDERAYLLNECAVGGGSNRFHRNSCRVSCGSEEFDNDNWWKFKVRRIHLALSRVNFSLENKSISVENVSNILATVRCCPEVEVRDRERCH
jgi:hypothetical protein